MRPLPVPAWRGRVEYRRALAEQRQRRQRVIQGEREAIWLLEHPPVITLGRRSAADPSSTAGLGAVGCDVVVTERGGLLTWHGPGQIVGYFIVDLGVRGLGSRRFVHAIEQGMIDWLGMVGVMGERIDGLHGVWCGGAKIGSVGLHIRKRVTLHGMSLNLCPDLTAFERFTACGVEGGRTTSVLDQTGQVITPSQAALTLGQIVCRAIEQASVDT